VLDDANHGRDGERQKQHSTTQQQQRQTNKRQTFEHSSIKHSIKHSLTHSITQSISINQSINSQQQTFQFMSESDIPIAHKPTNKQRLVEQQSESLDRAFDIYFLAQTALARTNDAKTPVNSGECVSRGKHRCNVRCSEFLTFVALMIAARKCMNEQEAAMVSMLQSSAETSSANILLELLSSDRAAELDSAKRARLAMDPNFRPKVRASQPTRPSCLLQSVLVPS
jgi:hypothetical protein